MEKASKIFVANSTEMLGSAIFRESKKSNFVNIISSTSKELYQRNQNAGIKMYKFYKKKYGYNFISGMSSNLHEINNNINAFK